MKRKISLLLLILCCGFIFTGCRDVINLSDEETAMIAEYAAELLLKYDANYVDKIAEVEDLENGQQDDSISTEAVQEITTEQIEEATTESSSGNNLNNNIDKENVDADMNTPSGSETNIARIAGVDGVDITYKEYLVTDHYPATDEEGEFIYLDATDGYQLLVVKFRVASTVGEELSVSLFDKKIDYRIVCNDKHAAEPMLTILMDDLGTLETTLSPGEEKEAVLIFQISDSMKDSLSSIKLKVGYNNVDNIINILN